MSSACSQEPVTACQSPHLLLISCLGHTARKEDSQIADRPKFRFMSGQTDIKADRQKTDMRSVPLCWQTNVQKELSSWMASSFKVTAGVSHSLLIYLSVMVTRSLQQTQALSWKTRGDLFFHILQWAPSMPGIGIWKAAHCLKQSLITPLKWKPLTLDFNLIIIVSFHEQGNYSTETSNSGFLSKYLQWLMRLVWFPVLPVRQSLKRLVFMRTNWTSICYNEKFWQNKKEPVSATCADDNVINIILCCDSYKWTH